MARKYSLRLIIPLVGAVIVGTMLQARHAESAAPPITLGSAINSAGKGNLAEVAISNSCSTTIRFCLCETQARSNGRWPPFPLVLNDKEFELRADQCTNAVVPMPSGTVGWRLPLFWTAPPTVMHYLINLRDRFAMPFRNWKLSILFRTSRPTGHSGLVYSPEYVNDEGTRAETASPR